METKPLRLHYKIEYNNACALYRALQPAKFLRKKGHKIATNINLNREHVRNADIVICQRPQENRTWVKLEEAKAAGKKIILEFDDDQFSIPEWNPAYKPFKGKGDLIRHYISLADGVTVSTAPLLKVYGEYNSNIVVLPNSIDFDQDLDIAGVPLTLSMPKPNPKYEKTRDVYHIQHDPTTFEHYQEVKKGRKVIAWGGSPTHLGDLRTMTEDLIKLMGDRDDFVVVWMAAAEDHAAALGDPKRQFFVSGVTARQYRPLMKKLDLDIGLAPVMDVTFNHSKSNLKAIEYMSLGIVPVCTDIVTYAGTYEHGKEGFYARGKYPSWYEVLNDLLDRDLEPIKVAAKERALAAYDQAKTVSQWESFYYSML